MSGTVYIHGRVVEEHSSTMKDIFVEQPFDTIWSTGDINYREHNVMGRLQDWCAEYYAHGNIEE